MTAEYPILEFDNDLEAVIKPVKCKGIDIPKNCVFSMSPGSIKTHLKEGSLTHIFDVSTWMGVIPVYEYKCNGIPVAVLHPGVTAPFVVAVFEVLIASGFCKFVAYGTAGVLDSSIGKGSVVIPESAVRDEGISYHYVAPRREIKMDPDVVNVIENVLIKNQVDYRIGKTWTLDALFRETKGKIEKRKSEGCITVEMECSAFLAVSRFRRVKFGQILFADDDISKDNWDSRKAVKSMRLSDCLPLAAEACLGL